MSWCEELFGHEKPVIALLHLNAFPGDPLYKKGDSMKKTVEDARHDLHALQDGGVDGILFSNEFSLPYQSNVDPVQPCGMARVIGELMSEITVPYGIDLECDPMAALDLAAAVDASFIRGTFTGAYVGVEGISDIDTSKILRRKKALGLDNCRLLYFLNNESDDNLVPVKYPELAKAIIFDCKPDAFCMTGAHAGIEANSTLIEDVREAIKGRGVPVFAATGCRRDNIKQKLDISDGALVGTTFKVDGVFENHIDPQRVKDFMAVVAEYRKEHND